MRQLVSLPLERGGREQTGSGAGLKTYLQTPLPPLRFHPLQAPQPAQIIVPPARDQMFIHRSLWEMFRGQSPSSWVMIFFCAVGVLKTFLKLICLCPLLWVRLCLPHFSKGEEMFLDPELDEALHWAIHWGVSVPCFLPVPRKSRAVWESRAPSIH